MSRRSRAAARTGLAPRRLACLLSAGLLVACQPVDVAVREPDAVSDRPKAPAPPDRGAPGTKLPVSPQGLVTLADSTAQAWLAEAVAVEVLARVDGDRVVEAEVTYVAGEAERMLLVGLADGGGVATSQPTLDGLDLIPVTTSGLEAVPPMPEGAPPVPALAAAAGAALADCEATAPVTEVRYATGAPYAWDGAGWTTEPTWTAAVSGGDARGAVVSPVTGAAAGGCFTLSSA